MPAASQITLHAGATSSLRDRLRARTFLRRAPVAAMLGCLIVVLFGMLLTPTPAQAQIPVIGPIAEAVGSIGGAILHPANAALNALLSVLRAIFGGLEAKLVGDVIQALLSIPSFQTGHVAGLEHTMVAISAGMLSAVFTLSIVRYYLAGLTNTASGAFEAVHALVRVGGAVALILLWPTMFGWLEQVPNLFDAALLQSGGVQHNVGLLFDAALVFGAGAFAIGTGVGLIFTIVIALAAALTFLALLWMKVMISILLMFLYVAMPVAIVIWPIPELSWIATAAMRALGVALIVPCVWAILFALSAAVNADILSWVPTHSILDTLLVRPLAGLTLMVLCITIPRSLMQAAVPVRVPQPAGRAWRTLTLGMFAARTGTGAARTVASAAADGQPQAQRMIGMLPESLRPPRQPGEGGSAARIIFGASGFDDPRERTGRPRHAGGRSRGAGTPGGLGDAGVAAGAQGSDSRVYAEQAVRRTEAQASVHGIEHPVRDPESSERAREAMRGRSRIAPPDATMVAGAMSRFPAATQRDLARIGSEHGLREFAAEHLRSANLTDSQRDALSTLGSARMPALQQGIATALQTLDGAATDRSTTGGAASAKPAGPAHAPAGSRSTPGERGSQDSSTFRVVEAQEPTPGGLHVEQQASQAAESRSRAGGASSGASSSEPASGDPASDTPTPAHQSEQAAGMPPAASEPPSGKDASGEGSAASGQQSGRRPAPPRRGLPESDVDPFLE